MTYEFCNRGNMAYKTKTQVNEAFLSQRPQSYCCSVLNCSLDAAEDSWLCLGLLLYLHRPASLSPVCVCSSICSPETLIASDC